MTDREQFLSDVIVTAVEGGIGYWSTCLQYQWESNVVVTDFQQHGGGTRATISPEDTDAIHTITPDTIEKGIVRIISGEAALNERTRRIIAVANRDNDASYIDSDAADAIVQAGLFGKLVYG